MNKELLQKIKDDCTLDHILKDYHSSNQWKKKGSNYHLHCPVCKTDHKLEYSEAKSIAKCFKCDTGASTAQSYLIKFQGLSAMDSVLQMARVINIDIPDESKIPKKVYNQPQVPSASTSTHKIPFLQSFLSGSGLTTEDINAEVFIDDDTIKEVKTYESMTVDSAFKKIPGDDVIINYYDLFGKPITYYRKNKSGAPMGKPQPFYRVRYANPETNMPDKNGNHPKYRSPYGSGSQLYIPKWVRTKFKKSSKIKTLYLQEGEKKADKATKHGLISVGVMGIHNIASNQQLPKEFELIIKRCQVENVVFVLDADWQDLSSNLEGTVAVDNRPKSFFRAVVKFRNHFKAFSNTGIDLNIYFGHVKPNDKGDKGIDDLMLNSLEKAEVDSLKDICEKAINRPDGDALYIKFYNITTVSEYAIMEHWGLHNIDAFIDKYKSRLKTLKKFKFNRVEWRIDEYGQKELAQPLTINETFFNVDSDKKGDRAVSFNHKRCYTFLQNRGFYRYAEPGNTYSFISIEDNVVKRVEPHQIKDFVIQFVKELNNEQVENMLYRGAKQYLGSESLGNMDYNWPQFYKPSINSQNLYFKNSFFHVTDKEIQLLEVPEAEGQIWEDSILDFQPKMLEPLFEIAQIDTEATKERPDLKDFLGEWTIDFSAESDKCDWIQFLLNTSRFYKRNRTEHDLELDEVFELTRHFLSKATSFGYLLHDFRNSGNEYAIVGMDGAASSVGDSNGRSGKSLFGKALEQLIPTVRMDGKTVDLKNDRFAFEEVNTTTKLIFIDDVKINFTIELLFAKITGHFTLERKGIGKTTLPEETVIKFYIPTNHALKGDGGSFEDRQRLIGFSEWYNKDWKPIDDFNKRFFDEWDEEQWNLFYNFAALSLHLYLKHGIIEAPKEKLMQRKLRQDIGEAFMDWADEYFSDPRHVNTKVEKDAMYQTPGNAFFGDGFLVKYAAQRKYTPVNVFKSKLKKYCKYRGYAFNPSKEGADIKTQGKEYIEIYKPEITEGDLAAVEDDDNPLISED